MISGTGINGGVRHCLALTRELAARGHEVTLFHRPGAWIAGELDSAAVRLAPTTLRLSHLPEIVRVGEVLADLRIEVLHTHLSGAHAYGAIQRVGAGLPVVATAHSRHLQLHWALNHRVIAPSPATATYHRRVNLVRSRNIVMIPNFVDAERLTPVSAASRLAARQLLGSFVVGSVGDISERKRQSDLVRATGIVCRAGVDCHLVLVGSPADREVEEVKAQIEGAALGDRVHLTGLRHDIPDILPAFDVYASSSQREEMPIAVMEAMAVGLPVVSTDVGGMAMLVAEGGNGFLVPAGAVEAIAERLLALARSADLRQRMGQASATKVADEFLADAIVPRVERVLAEAALAGRRWQRNVAKLEYRRSLSRRPLL
jgi:glycosyltransferase involved in cell wall biosynthesis